MLGEYYQTTRVKARFGCFALTTTRRVLWIPLILTITVLSTALAGAAPITWTTGSFTDDSVLTLAGTPGSEVYGADFLGTGQTAPLVTSNGFSFSNVFNGDAGATSNLTGNVSTTAADLTQYSNFATGTIAGTDTNFNTILGNVALIYAPAPTITLNNLTINKSYTVLALADDNRGDYTASETFTGGGGSPSADQQFTSLNPLVGGYFLGTFTADATSESIIFDSPTNGFDNGGQVNAILLTASAVPEPSTFAMFLLGGSLLTILVRRRGTQV